MGRPKFLFFINYSYLHDVCIIMYVMYVCMSCMYVRCIVHTCICHVCMSCMSCTNAYIHDIHDIHVVCEGQDELVAVLRKWVPPICRLGSYI